jgi:predicted nucleic acid-binding protein
MTLIVDASIAAKWFFEEEGSARALKLREEQDLTAPDFILLEVHHVMWKRLARSETEKAAVKRAQSALRLAMSRLAPSGALAEAAGDISLAYSLAVYDCLYLALAAATGDRLVTADQQQFSVARRMRLDAELF